MVNIITVLVKSPLFACTCLCLQEAHRRVNHTNIGDATKIDEYAPKPMPNISARAKYLMLSPPNKKTASDERMTTKVLLIERTSVCFTLA